jgi:hypothetical protein
MTALHEETLEETQRRLDEARAKANGHGKDQKEEKKKQADVLIEIAVASASLYHTPAGTGFADLDVAGVRQTWPIRSRSFKQWLAREYYQKTNGAANSDAVQSALSVLEAKAHFDGTETEVHIRVAELGDKYYLDLCDDRWRAVEISAEGWQIVDEVPVRFRRTPGMLALAEPEQGADLGEELGQFLNLADKADFVLIAAWLWAALRPHGPYPPLVLAGEQGSAKSTLSAVLKMLIDPNTAPLRALPREDRDLFIAASNGYVLCFDNVSGLPTWISDTLCRLATGGGFAVRQLYTDQDEVLFDAQRPMILNGIEDVVTRPDLADRSLFIHLATIPEDRRKPEAEIMSGVKAAAPKILGALLDAVAAGKDMLPQTKLARLPRMADFALWVTACEQGMGWDRGDNNDFMAIYTRNIVSAVEQVIDSNLIGSALLSFMEGAGRYDDSAKNLLGALSLHVDDRISRSKYWPKTPRKLAGDLRRLAPALRKWGLTVDFYKQAGGSRQRRIRIENLKEAEAE